MITLPSPPPARPAVSYELILQQPQNLQSDAGKQVEQRRIQSRLQFIEHRQDGAFATLLDLRATLEPVPDEEDFILPTRYALDRVFSLIIGARWLMPTAFPQGTPSATGSGGIRINWRHRNRDLSVLVPARPTGVSYIYHHSPEGHAEDHNVSAEILARWLEWLTRA